MSESTKTVACCIAALIGILSAYFAQPAADKAPEDYAMVGESFFPDFSPTDATKLSVVSYDEKSGEAKEFSVDYKNKKWKITSHLDYPADGKDRLAKTAVAVTGIVREEFITSDVENHKALGVIDPEDTKNAESEGRGTKVTLWDEKDEILSSYVVGKEIENRSGYRYVRRSDEESSVYAVKWDFSPSTKFSDWIEADLLQLQSDQIREVLINRYSIDEAQGTIVDQETNRIFREKSADPWQLEGLDKDAEELEEQKIRDMVFSLDDLKILGVRKKPEQLSSNLKSEDGIAINRETSLDLASRGFRFVRTADGMSLLSNEGETIVTTGEGVVYVLRFGELFTGSDLEIETGLSSKPKKEADEGKDEEGKEEGEKEKGDSARYLFVMAQFDETAIGPPPTPPSEQPPPQEESNEAEPGETKPDEAKPDETKPDEAKPSEEKSGETPPSECQLGEGVKTPKKTKSSLVTIEDKPESKEDPVEAAKKKYEKDLEEYKKKIEAGQKKVQDLNARFADWYYVISGSEFDKIRLSRKELIKPKKDAKKLELPETLKEESEKKPLGEKGEEEEIP